MEEKKDYISKAWEEKKKRKCKARVDRNEEEEGRGNNVGTLYSENKKTERVRCCTKTSDKKIRYDDVRQLAEHTFPQG